MLKHPSAMAVWLLKCSMEAHLSWGFRGEGSAEEVRLLDWLLWREPLCEEPEREAERRKGCAKNSSKVRRSTGLRLSRPCSSAAQEADNAFRMGSGICASCRSIARSSATWLAPLKGGLPAGAAGCEWAAPVVCCLYSCMVEQLTSCMMVAPEMCMSRLSDACSSANWLLLVAVQDFYKQHASLKLLCLSMWKKYRRHQWSP